MSGIVFALELTLILLLIRKWSRYTVEVSYFVDRECWAESEFLGSGAYFQLVI